MADYVPKGGPAKYNQGFKEGEQVWVKIPKAPEIVACVKEAYYDEVNDGWTYVVQEKDSTGKWYGPERAKRAKHLKRAGESEQVFPSPAPTLATNLLPEDDESPRKVDYTEDKVQQDADLQIKGSDWMSDNKSRGFYRRVFVLLLSWYPDCDDLAVDEEVQRLGATFKDTYNFDVKSVHIDSRETVSPQVQANLAIANFVANNDQEQALFIVYYAGHGFLRKIVGDLNMRRRQIKQNVAKEFGHITLNLVERNLNTTLADVFLIFDCCHADDLRRESTLNSRSFEFLAASTSGFTPSPGEKSFTSALIWALEKLAAPESSPRGTSTSLPMIPTSKLAKMIREAPHFPKDQYPSLTAKDLDAYRHIVLAPLPREPVNYAYLTAQKGSDQSKATNYELTVDSVYTSEVPSSQHHREAFGDSQERATFDTKPQRELEHIQSVLRGNEPNMVEQRARLHPDSSHANSTQSDIFSSNLDISISSRSSVVESAQGKKVSVDPYHESRRITEPDSDIISVASITDDIYSLSSAKRTYQETIAEDHLSSLLAQRRELKPLYEEALEKLDRTRFVENFRRLLKLYYLDLLGEAKTNLQHATIHLLRSRWARVRISNRLAGIIRPENAEDESQMVLDTDQSVLDLESWIASNEGLAPPMDNNIDDAVDDEESSDDGNESDDDKPTVLPNISEMEHFLTEGDPFRNLSVNMRLFLLPASLTPLSRIIMSVPNERIWYSREEDLSLLNRAKIAIENATDENWKWWPLKPLTRPLGKDQIRMNWRCHCGEHMWKELSTTHANSYQALLRERGNNLEHNHLCKTGCSRSPVKFSLTTLAQTAAAITQSVFNPPASSSGSTTVTTSSKTSTPTIKGSKLPSHSTSLGNQQGSQVIPNTATSNNLFILFGVKGPRRTPGFDQIDAQKYAEDEPFFHDLKKAYKTLRGFWRYWFSVWRLRYCDFVKFEKIRPDRIICRGKDLPTSSLYVYAPRPPQAEDPPISPHEFELAFASCRSTCPLSLIHDCVEPPTGSFALSRIPKRVSALEVKVSVVETAWGIQAQHSISFLGMVVYHALILAGTFGFWGWWMVAHPGDLQNAAVPISTVIALLSLFWSTAGVLKSLREPV